MAKYELGMNVWVVKTTAHVFHTCKILTTEQNKTGILARPVKYDPENLIPCPDCVVKYGRQAGPVTPP